MVTKIWGIQTLVCRAIAETVQNTRSFAKIEKYLGATGQ